MRKSTKLIRCPTGQVWWSRPHWGDLTQNSSFGLPLGLGGLCLLELIIKVHKELLHKWRPPQKWLYIEFVVFSTFFARNTICIQHWRPLLPVLFTIASFNKHTFSLLQFLQLTKPYSLIINIKKKKKNMITWNICTCNGNLPFLSFQLSFY